MLAMNVLQANGSSYSLVGSPVVLCANAVCSVTSHVIEIQVEWRVKEHVSYCT